VVAEPLPSTPQALIDRQAPRDRVIWLVPFHRAELALAGGLLRLLDASVDRLASFQTVDWTVALDWLRQRTGVTLAPEQEAAVRLALTERVAVLTGGPGCGKSYTVRAVVALARAKRARILLAAPTGRAAKRLSELAGLEAATLHRLLQLRPGGDAAFDRDHPLDADLVVVDEASMLDMLLANKLIKAIPPGAHLLFVGDVDQLPSVGAGEVLRDRWPPSASPGSGSPMCSARPNRAEWLPTPTASTPASPRSPTAWPTSSCSPRTTPTGSPTWSSRLWPTGCPGASASTRDARCRCCVRCVGDRPARGC
jgi:AAA domain